MKSNFLDKSYIFYGWLLVIVLSSGIFYVNYIKNNNINSDISSILPAEDQEAEELNQLFNKLTSKNIIWMLKTNEQDKLIDAVKRVEASLASSKILNIKASSPDALKNLYKTLIKNPTVYLSSKDKGFLKERNYDQLTQSRLDQLFSPFSTIDSSRLKADPLLLAEFYFKEFANQFDVTKRYGSYLGYEKEGSHYLLINLQLNGSPFDLDTQESYLAQVSIIEQKLQNSKIELLQLGVIGYAAYETQQGLYEAQFIGLGSLFAVFVLVTIIFRSLAPLILMSLVIGMSVLIALAWSSVFFADIHILSILVGASLIGISVDYVFHYFAKNTQYQPQSAATKIFKPVSLGLLTSVLGYLALYFSGLIVLKQIALISSIGLFAAYMSTLILLPRVKFDLSSKPAKANKLFTAINNVANASKYKRAVLAISLIAIIVGAIKLPAISFNDNLELLHASPKHLKQQQSEIESLVQESNIGLNLVIKADNEQKLLEQAEQYEPFFEAQLASSNLQKYITPHIFLPSVKQQKQNKEDLIAWLHSESVNSYLELIENSNKDELLEKISTSQNLRLDSLAETPYQNFIDQLIVSSDTNQLYGLIKLIGVKDPQPFIKFAEQTPKLIVLDSKTSFNEFLKGVRTSSIELVAYAYLFILLILLAVFGIKLGWKVFLPPLGAAIIAVLFASAMGQALNVFHIVALTLVLGIGIDYTIFYASSKESHKTDMIMAISCSMISTVLAFGLMSFSRTPAVAGFGTIVLVGILMVYLLSPLAKGESNEVD